MIDVPTGISAGRTVTLDRADVGTTFVQVLDYIGACPGLHTFLFRGQRRADDPEAAALEGNVIGRLHFGAGNARERVDFDLTEGGACVTVPVERSAYFEARFEDVGGEAPVLWESVSVTAMGMPGASSQRKDLSLTSNAFDLVGGVEGPIVAVPRYAYAVLAMAPAAAFYDDAQVFLQFFAGDSSASARLYRQRMRQTASPGAGVADATVGNPVPLGSARAINLLSNAAGHLDVRFVFFLRL